MHFHRRRIFVGAAFVSTYSTICYKSTNSQNEIFRMGVAGSLANVVVESGFHFMDTVNVRSKLYDGNISSFGMVKAMYMKEGLIGFSKGISACFYGSIACGFIYFSLYKLFKKWIKDWLGSEYHMAWTYFSASFLAEFFTLIVYYPFDLVKCRLQSKNYKFKYRNIPHAFRKEIKNGSIFSLYQGSLPFLFTYCICVSAQFTIYEYIMQHYKIKYGEDFKDKEFKVNMYASAAAGAISSAFTNSLDVITINKQANSEMKIMDII